MQKRVASSPFSLKLGTRKDVYIPDAGFTRLRRKTCSPCQWAGVAIATISGGEISGLWRGYARLLFILESAPSLFQRMKKKITHKELHAAIQCLDDKKADEITVLDLQDNSAARYFVIATANSSTHLTALKNALLDYWKKKFSRNLRSESRPGSSWQVVDIDDVMVHLFTSEERARYNLEGLWGDAKQLKLSA